MLKPNTRGHAFRDVPRFYVEADRDIIGYFLNFKRDDSTHTIEKIAIALLIPVVKKHTHAGNAVEIDFKDTTLEQVKVAHIGTFLHGNVGTYEVEDNVSETAWKRELEKVQSIPFDHVMAATPFIFGEYAADIIIPRPTSPYRLLIDPYGEEASTIAHIVTKVVDGKEVFLYSNDDLVIDDPNRPIRDDTKSFRKTLKKILLYYKLAMLRL